VLFEQGTFNVQSRHHNLIAFSVDVGLLLKVLRSASGNDTERLEAKLVQKAVRLPGQDEPEQRPFMSFTAKVMRLGGAQCRSLRVYVSPSCASAVEHANPHSQDRPLSTNPTPHPHTTPIHHTHTPHPPTPRAPA